MRKYNRNIHLLTFNMAFYQEYIGKSTNELKLELRKQINRYNEYTDSYLILYVADLRKNVPDISLNMEDYYMMVDLMRDVAHDNLSLYIQTPGGNGVAAEEIVKSIRNRFDELDVVVSGEAKSAGTILTLSADRIHMTETGALGPIDAQMQIGRSVVSAYDYKDWVETKREEAAKNGELNPFDATMVAQINPGELKNVYQQLHFAHDLVEEWLCKYKFKNWDYTETRGKKVTEEFKKKRAREIAEKLTDHSLWRSHGRSLKIEDLEEIGLKINNIEENDELADIVHRIHTILRFYFGNSTSYKILGTVDMILTKNAVKAEAEEEENDLEDANVIEGKVECENCNKTHKFYIKLEDIDEIDEDYEDTDREPFPEDEQLVCDECGNEIDLSGLANKIEDQTGKEIVN